MSVRVAGSREAGSGTLQATVCLGDVCAEGRSGVAMDEKDQRLLIPLNRQLTIEPGASYTVRVVREGGAGLIALATFKLAPGTASASAWPSLVAGSAFVRLAQTLRPRSCSFNAVNARCE